MEHLEGKIDDELNFTDGEIDEIAQILKESRKIGASAKKPKSEKRQRGVVVSVRMTAQEFESISSLAEEASMSIGGFMRAAAIGSQITQPLYSGSAFAIFSFSSKFEPNIQLGSNLFGQDWIHKIEAYANSD